MSAALAEDRSSHGGEGEGRGDGAETGARSMKSV